MNRRSFLAGTGLAIGAAAFSTPRIKEEENLYSLSATAIARRVRAGNLSPVDVVEAYLERIDKLEPSVLAWVFVDRAGALEAARTLEQEAREGRFRGPLHGVPVGIKDIIAVAGMVTTNGSDELAHERPEKDATCVAKLRAAGAVILGKTATTQFASGDPAPTRNPWNLEHTPGGSSSGSAAGVASGMMPLALGTQTGGSVLRPAAYCGIVGLKPTHGRMSLAGVTPLAWSLDHLGIFARTDRRRRARCSECWPGTTRRTCCRRRSRLPTTRRSLRGARPPRLGIPKELFSDKVGAEVSAHLDAVASVFRQKGGCRRGSGSPGSQRTRFGAPMRSRCGSKRPRITGSDSRAIPIPTGRSSAPSSKRDCRFRATSTRALETCRGSFAATWRRPSEDLDAFLMPVAPTTAPRGLSSTGDPVFCVPGSFSGLPAIAIPSGAGEDGLPLSIQLMAAPFSEERLLSTASWCEAQLAFRGEPPVSTG